MKNANFLIAILIALTPLLPRPLPAAADAPASENTRSLTVHVVDPSGAPIAGAKVHRGVWTSAKFPPNGDATTDATGTVTFALPTQVRILRLWASHSGRVPMFVNFDAGELHSDPVPTEFTFTLAEGTTIGGFIHDDIGAPIPGAKIEVCVDPLVRTRGPTGIGQPVVNQWLAEGNASCVTDEHGFWALNTFPTGPDWRLGLRLQHPDHVSDQEWRGMQGLPFPLQQFRDQTAITVMQTGVRVTGTITAPDGRPVPKALVIWGDKPYHNTNVQEAFADDAGRFRFPPLAPGKTQLTVIAEGYAPVLKEIQLQATPQVENVQLQPGKPLTLRFVDPAGKPVPRVKILVTGWRGRETIFNARHSNVPYSKIPDEADDHGVYTWPWAPDDAVDYSFWKKGLKWSQRTSLSPGDYKITVDPTAAP